MKKIYNFSIILSFVGLWVTSIFSGNTEIILGFFLIFSFGILHGSNDLLLIHTFSNIPSRLMFLKILGLYIAIILLAVMLFYFIPSIALILFVLFSAFHFGEQHWESKQLNISSTLSQFFYFFYGLLVLQILFVLNADDCDDSALSYEDIDGDDYGVDQFAACGALLTGDCNDEDANTNPGTSEICDEVDNNCNGEVDEFVQSEFYGDLDGDGFGDFKGVIEKLDYIESLGITMVWMNPFFQSPLVDNGYDVSDYRAIHPRYGNMEDFEEMLEGFHQRGIKFVLDVVVNHSSEAHE